MKGQCGTLEVITEISGNDQKVTHKINSIDQREIKQ
jgi:hypothetical protein